jgi:hypothetical protein
MVCNSIIAVRILNSSKKKKKEDRVNAQTLNILQDTFKTKDKVKFEIRKLYKICIEYDNSSGFSKAFCNLLIFWIIAIL